MRFVIFVIDEQARSASTNEMAQIDAFNYRLKQNQHWVLAVGIGGPTTAELFDNREGAKLSQQGSLFKSDDFYSGFWVIEAASGEEASSLAQDASQACNRRVELRPLLQ